MRSYLGSILSLVSEIIFIVNELVVLSFQSFLYYIFLSRLQLSEIGIDDKFIGVSKSADAASRRYIYYKDEVLELPRGAALMKKWGPLPRSLIGLMVREPFVRKPDADEDISVHEFFRTRFQCDEVRSFLYVTLRMSKRRLHTEKFNGMSS